LIERQISFFPYFLNLLIVVRIFTQVDGSVQRILTKPRGNEIYSGYFLPFPVRIRKEPAGNIDGRWKQFSHRNLPVPEPSTFDRFQLPEKKERRSIRQDQYGIIMVSDRK
jgi:hypothetical protein